MAAVTVPSLPFNLSASVSVTCESRKDFCEPGYRVLKQFEDEFRDDDWANPTEQIILEDLRKFSGQRVRAVECRMTLCVAEVEARGNVMRFGNDLAFGRLDADHAWLSGIEDVENYPQLWITTRFFHRKK